MVTKVAVASLLRKNISCRHLPQGISGVRSVHLVPARGPQQKPASELGLPNSSGQLELDHAEIILVLLNRLNKTLA
jgi:hypothetical protein